MLIKTVTGIPNHDIPGHWLVPPWPAHASTSEIAGHFLRFHPRGATTTQWLDYYQGYIKALAEASTQHLTLPVDWRCHEELRDCLARCVLAYQKKLQAEAACVRLAS